MNWIRRLRRPELCQRPLKWVPILGELQKTLQRGEYLPLRPLPMFESNFVQVTNQGSPIYVHHGTNRLTMGVAASLPGLGLPDILLIARPPDGTPDDTGLILTRLIPMDLLSLYVHDLATCRLKLRLATGRTYYLELDAPSHELGFLFNRWLRLINLLREPPTTWLPKTTFTPPLTLVHTDTPASTWHLQDQCLSRRSASAREPTFRYATLASQRSRKVKTLRRRFKSQAVGDSVPLVWSHLEHGNARKKSKDKKAYRDAHAYRSHAQHRAPEKPSITIRTIFSIISNMSNTANTTRSSSKVSLNNFGEECSHGCFTGPSAVHLQAEAPNSSEMGSYDDLERFLWEQGLEELMDPTSSTLSSSATSHPAFYLGAPRFYPRHPRARARPPRAPPTQGAAPAAPFLLDRSQRVPAVQTPPRKTPGGQSRRNPPLPSTTMKTPVGPGPPWRAPHVFPGAPKTPARPGHARKHHPVSAHPPKAPGASGPYRKVPPPLALPPKTRSFQVQGRMTPDTPTQQVPASPPPDRKPPGQPRSSQEDQGAEDQQAPLLQVDTQDTAVLETRGQRRTTELPFGATVASSQELLVSLAREVTVDGLRGTHTQRDWTHRTTKDAVVDMPCLNIQNTGQRQTWVQAQRLEVEPSGREQSRPFSVEGLALAKMVIMARAQDSRLPSVLTNLPSWLSLHQDSVLSLWGLGPPPQQGLCSQTEGQPREPGGAPQVSPRSIREPGDPGSPSTSKAPIALPACRWEDLQPLPPRSSSPGPRPQAKAPLPHWKDPQELRRVPFHCPLARAGSTSEILLPSLLELITMTIPGARLDKVQEELGARAPSPSSHGFQRRQ